MGNENCGNDRYGSGWVVESHDDDDGERRRVVSVVLSLDHPQCSDGKAVGGADPADAYCSEPP